MKSGARMYSMFLELRSRRHRRSSSGSTPLSRLLAFFDNSAAIAAYWVDVSAVTVVRIGTPELSETTTPRTPFWFVSCFTISSMLFWSVMVTVSQKTSKEEQYVDKGFLFFVFLGVVLTGVTHQKMKKRLGPAFHQQQGLWFLLF